MLRYLLDDEIVEFKSFAAPLDKTNEDGSLIEVPDNLVAAVKTKKGSIGTLSFSWTYYGSEDNSTTIYCQQGTIKIYDNPNYALIVEYPDGSKVNYDIEKIQTNDNQTSTGMIDEFVSSILAGRQPIANGYDGLKSLRLVEKLITEEVTL